MVVAIGMIACGTKAQAAAPLDQAAAARFANLALACVHLECPNKISHTLQSADDVRPPHELTPVFFGCYDWHSSVHGHWLLARLAKTFPGTPLAAAARDALARSLTPGNIAGDVAYLRGPGRASFERPYGLAWLPKLRYPIRVGEHNQTAFAFGLINDWAIATHDVGMLHLIDSRARAYYLGDHNCPLSYEPSGEDFLSPCIAEADFIRRILLPHDYAKWLKAFLLGIPSDGKAHWLGTFAVYLTTGAGVRRN